MADKNIFRENAPWLKHPEEDPEMYKIFFDFYCKGQAGRNKRVLSDAWQAYRATQGMKPLSEMNPKSIRNLPQKWKRAFRGLNIYDGKKIDGLPSWEERAKAYDGFILGELPVDSPALTSKQKVLRGEEADGYQMLENWRFAFDLFKQDVERERNLAIKEGKSFDTGLYLKRLQELMRLRENISSFIRRSQEMSERVTVEKQITEDDVLRVVWTEPEKFAKEEKMKGKKLTDFEERLLGDLDIDEDS